MLSLFKSFGSFCARYLFYIQVILLSLTIMSIMLVQWTHTPYLLWLNIPLGIYGMYLQVKINLRLRRNKTLIMMNVLETVEQNPNISRRQVLNRLSIQFPLVPLKMFKDAFDEAVANQYMGACRN